MYIFSMKTLGLLRKFNNFLFSILESSVLQLDEREDKVRAIPEKRCVLILREIPQDTPKSVLGHWREFLVPF